MSNDERKLAARKARINAAAIPLTDEQKARIRALKVRALADPNWMCKPPVVNSAPNEFGQLVVDLYAECGWDRFYAYLNELGREENATH